jgi:rhamnosyltransferase
VLNLGASHARGELLVFQNSDGVPLDERVLERLVGAFDDPKVEAALARQLPRPEARGWVRREYAASFPDGDEAAPWITLSMPLAAMRRATWEAHPFYEAAWASEDTEWGLRARRRGGRIAYVPEACVMHSHDYTLRQGYGRRFVEGEADAFLQETAAPAWTTLRRTLSGVARDLIADVRAPHELVSDVARRIVDGVAYYRGLRHGLSRRRRGDRDPRLGQSVVLSRHESTR